MHLSSTYDARIKKSGNVTEVGNLKLINTGITVSTNLFLL